MWPPFIICEHDSSMNGLNDNNNQIQCFCDAHSKRCTFERDACVLEIHNLQYYKAFFPIFLLVLASDSKDDDTNNLDNISAG